MVTPASPPTMSATSAMLSHTTTRAPVAPTLKTAQRLSERRSDRALSEALPDGKGEEEVLEVVALVTETGL